MEQIKSNTRVSKIKKAVSLVNDAVKQILNYQSGKDSPIRTRFTHLNQNALGGIFKGNIITIAGISGSGKSHVLQQLEEDIFNKELNPNCANYALLRCNWEMTVFKLLLRKLKRRLDRSMKSILFEKTQGEDVGKFKSVCDEERSGDIYYLEEPCDPDEWYVDVRAFLNDMKHKEHVLVTIDHIALVRDITGGKKVAVDRLIENINLLKKEFTNVSFLILSQLNRDIESRTDIRLLAPKRSDLYQSDTIYHISDLVLVIHNPFRLGHDLYMLVPGLATNDKGQIINPRYAHLGHVMERPDNKLTNFKTKGLIFWHYLKVRELEDYMDIAVERFDVDEYVAEVSVGSGYTNSQGDYYTGGQPSLFGEN